MNHHRGVLVFLSVLGFYGPSILAPRSAQAEEPAPVRDTASSSSPALRDVRNHIGENFQNKGYHHRMMFLRAGGATARFSVRADGRVENLRFVNVSPRGGNNVAYFARQSILEASRRFRPFSPELRRTYSKLDIQYDFGNVGLRSARHANPDF